MKFLGFKYREICWSFRAMPFGLNIAQRKFTHIIADVVRMLEKNAIPRRSTPNSKNERGLRKNPQNNISNTDRTRMDNKHEKVSNYTTANICMVRSRI